MSGKSGPASMDSTLHATNYMCQLTTYANANAGDAAWSSFCPPLFLATHPPLTKCITMQSVKWRWESETKQCYKHPEPLAYVSRLSTTFILHRP